MLENDVILLWVLSERSNPPRDFIITDLARDGVQIGITVKNLAEFINQLVLEKNTRHIRRDCSCRLRRCGSYNRWRCSCGGRNSTNNKRRYCRSGARCLNGCSNFARRRKRRRERKECRTWRRGDGR